MILPVSYFLQFYISSFWGKNYFAKLNFLNRQEPEPQGVACFGPLEPEPLENKCQGPEPLGKKSETGAAWK